MKYKVFVYGTLKKGFRLHKYLKNAKFLGEGFIQGYDMYLVSWYPAVVKGKGIVYGEIYEVDEETLKILDKVEDEGVLYKRIEETIYLGKRKEKIKAFVYLYVREISNFEKITTGIFK